MYDDPDINEERAEDFKLELLQTIKEKLQSKCLDPTTTMKCQHDIFRHLFWGKGYESNVRGAVMLNKEDFVNLNFPPSWYYSLKKDSNGHCFEFPIRAKLVLRKSKKDFVLDGDGMLVQSPQYIKEVLTQYMTKQPCSRNSLL